MTQRRHMSMRRIFRIPALLAVVTAFGLVAALLGDGVWDGASWFALAVPLVVTAYCVLRPQ
ncbi:MAG TPA: hypothetical protein VGM35_05490 [Xanthobacteraceae bacterium]